MGAILTFATDQVEVFIRAWPLILSINFMLGGLIWKFWSWQFGSTIENLKTSNTLLNQKINREKENSAVKNHEYSADAFNQKLVDEINLSSQSRYLPSRGTVSAEIDKSLFAVNFKAKAAQRRIRLFLEVHCQSFGENWNNFPRLLIAGFPDLYRNQPCACSFGEFQFIDGAERQAFWSSRAENFPVMPGISIVRLIWENYDGVEQVETFISHISAENPTFTERLTSSGVNSLVNILPCQAIANKL